MHDPSCIAAAAAAAAAATIGEMHLMEKIGEKLILKNDVIFWKYTIFNNKMCFLLKNTTFELLDHHHELNQKKLILKEFFMFKIDSPMLKLWSISFFLV